jgi:hypothetical protein
MAIFGLFRYIAPLLLISACGTAPVYPVYQPPASGSTATITTRSQGYNSPVRVHDDSSCSKETAKLVGYLNSSPVFGPSVGPELTFKVPAGRMLGVSVITTLWHTGSWSWCPAVIDFWPEADKHYLVEVINDHARSACSYEVHRLDGPGASASKTRVRNILRPGCRLDSDLF